MEAHSLTRMKWGRDRLLQWLDPLLTLIFFGLLYLFLFESIPVRYLLADTIITGGDTASHYKTVDYLKYHLLPEGRLIGWYMGNYGGFPLFIMYFPLVYLIAVVLSFWMKLTVAFKIIAIAGPLMLPVCSYAMVRLFGMRTPAPHLAALGSVFFLYNTSNSMWGGNFYSTLAGEFTYAVSFSLTFVFFGVLFRIMQHLKTPQQSVPTGLYVAGVLLLFLIGFSHGFTLIICVLSSFYFLLLPGYSVKKGLSLLLIFGVGGLLFAWWFVQLFFNLPYTTAFNILWTFGSLRRELAPDIFLPSIILFVLFTLAWCIPSRFRFQLLGAEERAMIPFIWFVISVSALAFFSSETLHLPDIRFIPFIQYLVSVLGMAFLGLLCHRLLAQYRLSSRLMPFLIFCLTVVWMSYHPSNVKDWMFWNLKGVENTPRFNTFRTINLRLTGDYSEPRVVYEHNVMTNSMGTVRAFESLPFFSGRTTLEGLYFQSSLLSPFVFYTQSLYSKEISCPFPDYPCSRFDLERAIDYLQLFNVSQMIMISQEAKDKIRQHSGDYTLQYVVPYSSYEIWKAKIDPGYVKPILQLPEWVEPQGFRNRFYHWFRSYTSDKRFLYTVPTSNAWLYGLDEIPKQPDMTLASDKDCQVREMVDFEAVTFSTQCVGQPHLIKVSYNPGWQVQGADGPYLISPALMMVVPRQEEVRLYFDNAPPRVLGQWLNGLGVVLFGLLLVYWSGRVPWFNRQVKRLVQAVERPWLNKIAWLACIGLFGLFVLMVVMDIVNEGYHAKFQSTELAYTHKNYAKAQKGFQEIIDRWPQAPTIDKIYYFHALSLYLDEKCDQALKSFRKIYDFADSEYLAEAWYHDGICSAKLEDFEQARRSYQYVIEVLDDPVWGSHAKARLRELPAP